MNRKNVTVIRISVAQQLIELIKSSDPFKMEKWCASNFVSDGNGLRFNMKHPNFTGEVVVSLNIKENSYMITFYKYMSGNKKKREKCFTNLKLSEITNTVDDFIREQ
jgi:hypothetical protein